MPINIPCPTLPYCSASNAQLATTSLIIIKITIVSRDGAGVAGLPESLVTSDPESGALIQIGAPRWQVPLKVSLYRKHQHSNHLTRAIWTFLALRETAPLVSLL